MVVPFQVITIEHMRFRQREGEQRDPFGGDDHFFTIQVRGNGNSVCRPNVTGLIPIIFYFRRPIVLFIIQQDGAFLGGQFACRSPYFQERLVRRPIVASHGHRHRLTSVRRVEQIPITRETSKRRLLLNARTMFVFTNRPMCGQGIGGAFRDLAKGNRRAASLFLVYWHQASRRPINFSSGLLVSTLRFKIVFRTFSCLLLLALLRRWTKVTARSIVVGDLNGGVNTNAWGRAGGGRVGYLVRGVEVV